MRGAVRKMHRLGFQIDLNPGAVRGLEGPPDGFHRLSVEHHRQQSVLRCVAVKDVAKARRDDTADAGVMQGIDGGFTG